MKLRYVVEITCADDMLVTPDTKFDVTLEMIDMETSRTVFADANVFNGVTARQQIGAFIGGGWMKGIVQFFMLRS